MAGQTYVGVMMWYDTKTCFTAAKVAGRNKWNDPINVVDSVLLDNLNVQRFESG